MAHWFWYWKIKKQHTPRKSCSNFDLIDSFSMYNNYKQVRSVRASADKCSLYIPRYELKAYLQDDDSLLVNYQNGSYLIPVEKKQCNFGGFYYFFRCPLCNKRMQKLYCLDGQYLCRKCGNLAYYIQRVIPSERFMLMQINIKNYIKNRGGNLELNEKPPRMHKKTFQKFKDQAAYYDAKWGLARYKEGRQWYGAKIERWLDGYFEYE